MKILKNIAVIFIATVFALLFACIASARQIDFAEWNNHEEVIVIADRDAYSNSGLKNAQLKVKYDYPSRRMRLFFLLKFNSFGEEGNPGVCFSFNGEEELSINLNGETEYNEDKYYLILFLTQLPLTVLYILKLLSVSRKVFLMKRFCL